MSFMIGLGVQRTPVATRWVALKWLGDAENAARTLGLGRYSKKRGRKEEALHDYRVALRRLRGHASAYQSSLAWSNKQLGVLRRLHRETAALRDHDVQHAWLLHFAAREGIEKSELPASMTRKKRAPVSEEHLQQFARWAKRARRTIETAPVHGLEQAPPFSVSVGRAIAALLPQVEERLAALTTQAGDGKATRVDTHRAVHKARLSLKRTRYLLAPLEQDPYGLAPVIEDCRYLQSCLGDAHDLFGLQSRLEASTLDGNATAIESLAEVAGRAADAAVQAACAQADSEVGFTTLTGAPAQDDESTSEETRPCSFRWWTAGLKECGERLEGKFDAIEIERKYLLKNLPARVKKHGVKVELEQGYLPGKEIRERIRRIRTSSGEESYRRTIKAGRGVQRIEFEEPMTAEMFAQLWPLTEGARLTKNRYVLADGDLVWEIDEFTDRQLWLAEVELESADQLPKIPRWLKRAVIRDVSEESGFVNQKLAR